MGGERGFSHTIFANSADDFRNVTGLSTSLNRPCDSAKDSVSSLATWGEQVTYRPTATEPSGTTAGPCDRHAGTTSPYQGRQQKYPSISNLAMALNLVHHSLGSGRINRRVVCRIRKARANAVFILPDAIRRPRRIPERGAGTGRAHGATRPASIISVRFARRPQILCSTQTKTVKQAHSAPGYRPCRSAMGTD